MLELKISDQEFSAMRALLEDMCGILVAENKAYLIETRLASCVHDEGCRSFSEFHQKLKYGHDHTLRDKVIDLMTTNETLWFRDSHPFKILKNDLLPEYAREAREGKRNTLRIWSAACSTGQEPYSIGMTILDAKRDYPELRNLKYEILATDISRTALRLAKMARYEAVAMSRGLPEEYKHRYFKNEGAFWSLNPEVKDMVTLKQFNLQDNLSTFGRFDIILCRNVAIYFSDAFKRDLFSRFQSSLYPGGIFFLGASESMACYSTAFKMQNTSGGVYYRLKSHEQRGGT
jgi:chemotaxis protein methyltransferase CheR